MLVCGDQPLYRGALASLIERSETFRVAAESGNAIAEIQRVLSAHDVDIVVVDFDVAPEPLHDIAALADLLDSIAPRPTLVVSAALDPEACQIAVRHGASGIVFKASGADVLLAAIDSVQRGQVWLDRELLPDIFDDTNVRRGAAAEKGNVDRLTPREREIMQVACTGITNKEIANQLSISEATVRHHLGSIFYKLGVSTRSELVVFGYRHNLTMPRLEK